MHHWPETNESLILRVKDPADAASWSDFLSIYRPVVDDHVMAIHLSFRATKTTQRRQILTAPLLKTPQNPAEMKTADT